MAAHASSAHKHWFDGRRKPQVLRFGVRVILKADPDGRFTGRRGYMKTLFVAAMLILGLMAPPGAEAQKCQNSQYKGVYSALALGDFIVLPGLPPPLLGPTTRLGRVEVDGNGGAKVHAITSLNGFILEEDYVGPYVVKPDCTADVILNIPFPGVGIIPFQFKGVFSENLQQLDIMLVNPPGSTVSLTLRQQNRANCASNDLRGGYAVNMRGSTGLPLSPTLFTRLGRVEFNGTGGFSAETSTSSGGIIAPDNFSGTYSVNPSCSVTMSYAGNIWSGVLLNNSSEANVMLTSPGGTTVSGSLKKQ